MNFSAKSWAVIVAAGAGKRLDSEEPKQFISVAGRPLLLWSVETFQEHPAIAGLTLVLPAATLVRPPDWLRTLEAPNVILTAGGATRTDSVRLGLDTVPAEIGTVAVHDGARPLISAQAISRVLDAVTAERGAIAARRVTDSLKQVDATGRVTCSVSRENLWRAETPQAFPRRIIVDLHRRAHEEGVQASDCATLCEEYGVEVAVVEVFGPNPKVTRTEDLDLVEVLLRRRSAAVQPAEG
ncbi:MAG: 2-C-methyl-D-erythritol 4-phosphate cytidylyltransferase [Gemmatimonadota bacterium]|nr:MAG: 2-C-methyl-D-erythritol 4-phosphate cytidylyltransferase [Gemmatimonadota bacterium]